MPYKSGLIKKNRLFFEFLSHFWPFWAVLPSDESCFRMHFRDIYTCLRYKYVIFSAFERFQGLGRALKLGLSRVGAYSEVVDFRDFEPFVAILGGTSLR